MTCPPRGATLPRGAPHAPACAAHTAAGRAPTRTVHEGARKAGAVKLHYEDGTLQEAAWRVLLSADRAGWAFSSLRILELAPGGGAEIALGDEETAVLPLSGSCRCAGDGHTIELSGRTDVFSGPTDWCYVPCRTRLRISSTRGGRFALAGAKATAERPWRHYGASEVGVELRGAGRCSRRVTNYCMGDVEAERLLVCEVVTPAGNWSSYPPHKHDEDGPGERALEEIYYFEIAPGPRGEAGIAYQRLYGTPARPIELLAEVRHGDVVLIPHGYHGPSMAVPGYDLYYLNVMAGPGERRWLASDDPAHAFIRESWTHEEIDERLSSGVLAGGH